MTPDAIHPNVEVAKRLEHIYSLHRVESDFRLERSPYNDLLDALGNPHFKLPPTIHIAGTNGKGSTLAFLKHVYEAAGYSVHSYTSPHLIKFNERIVLNGQMISDDLLLHYLERIETANNGQAITFFEYTTALAFAAFADHPADVCLLETGLGGRLDCTNIIPSPAATVITAIGYDHMDYLGNTIQSIAGEKAAIMKENAPCIIAHQNYADDIADIFINYAQKINVPLYLEGRDWSVKDIPVPPLGLIGDHQQSNAATAIKTVSLLQARLPVPDQSIITGLANTYWPARMERITHGAVFDMLPPEYELWFDCGHNTDGAQTIARQLEKWKRESPDRPIHLIIGIAADKDAKGFVEPLLPYSDSLTCIDLLKARNPQTASALKDQLGIEGTTAHDVKEAIDLIALQPSSRVLITGSLYLYNQLCY